MSTIDLAPARTHDAEPGGTLEGLPRRVALTLPELQLLAERAGGAPLPFDINDAADGSETGQPASSLESRLGAVSGTTDEQAYADALASLHDPAETLTRRGLLTDDGADPALAGAIGLLATPTLALDLEVVVGDGRARAWHRRKGEAVATLATADGVVFELAWFPTDAWADELARVAVVPEEAERGGESAVPSLVDLPYELLDAALEAIGTGRADLVPVLVGQYAGRTFGADGAPVADLTVTSLLSALAAEARGRLRAMTTDTTATETPVVGVLSWTLLADGWRSLRGYQSTDPRTGSDGGERRVEIARVAPADLAPALAPVFAEVTR